jgi:DNA-binding Xre family transcriptional regulator
MIKSKVREEMESKGVTVRKLMDLTGLADGTILRARDARIGACTLNTLATIAAALGVGTKDLYEEE